MISFNGLVRIGLLSCFAIQFSACAPKIEGSSEVTGNPPAPRGEFDKPSIQGPDVEGTWVSKCQYDFNYQYKIVSMKFAGQNFTYSKKVHSDSSCRNVVQSDEYSGPFQFSEQVSGSDWTVDYHYIYNGINYLFDGQQMRIENNAMYISGFTWGTPIVDMSTPLTRVQP